VRVVQPAWLALPVLALALAWSVTGSSAAGPAFGPGVGGAGQAAETAECFVLAPPVGEPLVSDRDECAHRTAPASTFKIPHALIALDTAVITPATVVKWDGTKYDFTSWRRDHTLESAIKSSVYPFFQHTAALIGRERMLKYLERLDYGSKTYAGDQTTFWTNGDLQISPLEQVAFLRRMFAADLPVDRRHIETVKADLTMPRGQISNAAGLHQFPVRWGTAVRAKTGNTTVGGERVSWLVGAVESDGKDYVFAARIRTKTRTLETTAGAAVALKALNAHPPRP
jgi:beta-lactamase class D